MANLFIQGNAGTVAGTATNVAPVTLLVGGQPIQVGDLICVAFNYASGAGTPSVKDTLGNTYNLTLAATPEGGILSGFAYCFSAFAGADTVQIFATSSTTGVLPVIAVYRGPNTARAVPAILGQATTTTPVTNSVANSTGDLTVAAFGMATAGAGAAAGNIGGASGTLREQATAAATATLILGDNLSSTAGTNTGTVTVGTTSVAEGAIAAFFTIAAQPTPSTVTKVTTEPTEYIVMDVAPAGNFLVQTPSDPGPIVKLAGCTDYDFAAAGGANAEAATNGGQAQGTNPFGAGNTVLVDPTHPRGYVDPSIGTVVGNPTQPNPNNGAAGVPPTVASVLVVTPSKDANSINFQNPA